MFKKSPQVKSSSNIKTSERRHLLSEICTQYGIDKEALTKEQELLLAPTTTKQAAYQSIQDHKGVIYFTPDEQPIWFRVRDSPLYPTIYTLWRAAYLLPIILTNDHVVERIIGNANLMLPGCIPPLSKAATRGALVAVASYRSPTVIKAIGTCALNLSQFDDVQGRVGEAVTIIHRIDDELFNLYQGDVQIPEDVDSTEKPRFLADKAADTEEAPTEMPSESSVADPKDLAETLPDVDDLAETVQDLAVEDVDNFFIRSFLQSVKNFKIEVPINASTFMSEYILKQFPKMDPKFCNIKKSSWKKSAKFLKALEKMNYVSLKGKGDDVSITSFSVPPETIRDFVPHRTMDQPTGSGTTASKKELLNRLTVLSLYKPVSKHKMLLGKLNLNTQSLYTSSELKSILNDYIKVADLADKKNPKMVKFDTLLLSAVPLLEEATTRDKLFTSFLKGFSPNYTVLNPGESYSAKSVVKKGDPKKVQVLTQTVLGRKKTTTVVDFEQFNIKPQVLAEALKTKCSGSTAIGPCKHNPALVEVMVQGPHGPAIVEYLKEQGVPILFINFEDKSKQKKKR